MHKIPGKLYPCGINNSGNGCRCCLSKKSFKPCGSKDFLRKKWYNRYKKGGVKMFDRTRDMRGEVKIVDIDSLMPKEHLLRKIDKVINFEEV